MAGPERGLFGCRETILDLGDRQAGRQGLLRFPFRGSAGAIDHHIFERSIPGFETGRREIYSPYKIALPAEEKHADPVQLPFGHFDLVRVQYYAAIVGLLAQPQALLADRNRIFFNLKIFALHHLITGDQHGTDRVDHGGVKDPDPAQRG